MVREYIRYLKMVVPEQQNSADGDTVELPIGIDETVRLPFLRYCMWIPSKQWPILFAVI